MKHSKYAVGVCLTLLLALPLAAQTQSSPVPDSGSADQDEVPAERTTEEPQGEQRSTLCTETESLANAPREIVPGLYEPALFTEEGSVVPALGGFSQCETPCAPCDDCSQSTTGICCTRLLGEYCASVASCQCLQCAQ